MLRSRRSEAQGIYWRSPNDQKDEETGDSCSDVNYGIVTRRADETLAAVLSYEDKTPDKPGPKGPPPGPFMGLPDVEANYMTRFFTVRFDSSQNVIATSTDYIASIDKEDAIEMARKVLEGKQRGYMKAYRYVKVAEGDEIIVAFLNTGREQQSMLSLLMLTAVVSFISLVIVSFLLLYFQRER